MIKDLDYLRTPYGGDLRTQLLSWPDSADLARFDYACVKSIPDLPDGAVAQAELAVSHDPFGHISPATVRCERAGWVTTNVYRFKWNRLRSDGKPVPFHLVKGDGWFLALFLEKGLHRLEAYYDPPFFYRLCRALSLLVWGLMGLFCFLGGLRNLWKSLNSLHTTGQHSA